MEHHNVSPGVVARAHKLQRNADKKTAFRKNHSDELGLAIGLTKRSWWTFLGGCYLAYTDFKDGHDAKKAQRLLGVNKPLSNGATEDPAADKRFRKAMVRGMEIRAVRESDHKTLAVLATKQHIDRGRDERMAHNRDLAERYTSLSLGALQINRVKTATEMAGMLLHISPLANNERVRDVALGMMALSTGIGLVGERQYAGMVQREMETGTQLTPGGVATHQPLGPHEVTNIPVSPAPTLPEAA